MPNLSVISLAVGADPLVVRSPAPALIRNAYQSFTVPAPDHAPTMTVAIDPSLESAMDVSPSVRCEPNALRFVGCMCAWNSDELAQRVDATIAPNPQALDNAIAAWVSVRAARRGALLLHAAAIRCGQGACLLLGPSGAGKSTACRCIPHRALSPNAVVLQRHRDRWFVYPTPFCSSNDVAPAHPEPLPLLSAFVLEQSTQPHEPSAIPALATRISHWTKALVAHFPFDNAHLQLAIDAVVDLARSCPMSKLRFTRDQVWIPD